MLEEIELQLQEAIKKRKKTHSAFYKTNEGDYAEHEKFLGVYSPTLQIIERKFLHMVRKAI